MKSGCVRVARNACSACPEYLPEWWAVLVFWQHCYPFYAICGKIELSYDGLYYRRVGTRLCLCNWASKLPYVQRSSRTDNGITELWRKPFPVPLCQPQILHGRERSWASKVRSHRLTAWAGTAFTSAVACVCSVPLLLSPWQPIVHRVACM
jgi:hypothetical protein